MLCIFDGICMVAMVVRLWGYTDGVMDGVGDGGVLGV